MQFERLSTNGFDMGYSTEQGELCRKLLLYVWLCHLLLKFSILNNFVLKRKTLPNMAFTYPTFMLTSKSK
jgi:hypothetical protein